MSGGKESALGEGAWLLAAQNLPANIARGASGPQH